MATDTITRRRLADSYSAAPAGFRAADFGGRDGRLVVSDGYASDRYRAVPAQAVQTSRKPSRLASELEPGCYRVAKIDAVPVREGEAVTMSGLVDGALRADRVELAPFMVDGLAGQVHVMAGEAPCAIFVTPDGTKVAVNADYLPTDGAEHASVPLPTYHARTAPVRWSLSASAEKSADRPLVFTRTAHSTATYVNGGSKPHASEWQALVMPVRLPAASS